MIRSAVPLTTTFLAQILSSALWLALLFTPPCLAGEGVAVNVDEAQSLRQMVGTEGMRVVVGAKTFLWDRGNSRGDDDEASVRPSFTGVVGRWRLQDGGSTLPSKTDEDAASASCSSPLKLTPQPTGELTYRLLMAAIKKGAGSGCPVIVEPGIYPIDRDVFLNTDDVILFCKPGAAFLKTRSANAFWFRGKRIRMSGRCEIDGGGFPGSGLIIDFSAQDSRVENVYSHHHGGHGVLNRGVRTTAEYVRTENNGQVGFANDAAKDADIRYLLSRENGNEGVAIDNPGTKSIRVVGGFFEGNCRKGGVGNIGVDAAEDVTIEGVVTLNPNPHCKWNMTAQNNVGNTERLSILGGYFSGAVDGDIYFRTNTSKRYAVKDSTVADIVSLSKGPAVAIDAGGERNSVSVKGYTGRLLMDMH